MMLLTFNIVRIVCWLVVIALPVLLEIILPMCETILASLLAIILVCAVILRLAGHFIKVVAKSHAGIKTLYEICLNLIPKGFQITK